MRADNRTAQDFADITLEVFGNVVSTMDAPVTWNYTCHEKDQDFYTAYFFYSKSSKHRTNTIE